MWGACTACARTLVYVEMHVRARTTSNDSQPGLASQASASAVTPPQMRQNGCGLPSASFWPQARSLPGVLARRLSRYAASVCGSSSREGEGCCVLRALGARLEIRTCALLRASAAAGQQRRRRRERCKSEERAAGDHCVRAEMSCEMGCYKRGMDQRAICVSGDAYSGTHPAETHRSCCEMRPC